MRQQTVLWSGTGCLSLAGFTAVGFSTTDHIQSKLIDLLRGAEIGKEREKCRVFFS